MFNHLIPRNASNGTCDILWYDMTITFPLHAMGSGGVYIVIKVVSLYTIVVVILLMICSLFISVCICIWHMLSMEQETNWAMRHPKSVATRVPCACQSRVCVSVYSKLVVNTLVVGHAVCFLFTLSWSVVHLWQWQLKHGKQSGR